MDESQIYQIAELRKLDHRFYRLLALGQEPLTYTYREETKEKDVQVEVNARVPKNETGVLIDIDFDTGWSGRWIHTSKVHTYFVKANNEWVESSYDGSEFDG